MTLNVCPQLLYIFAWIGVYPGLKPCKSLMQLLLQMNDIRQEYTSNDLKNDWYIVNLAFICKHLKKIYQKKNIIWKHSDYQVRHYFKVIIRVLLSLLLVCCWRLGDKLCPSFIKNITFFYFCDFLKNSTRTFVINLPSHLSHSIINELKKKISLNKGLIY